MLRFRNMRLEIEMGKFWQFWQFQLGTLGIKICVQLVDGYFEIGIGFLNRYFLNELVL